MNKVVTLPDERLSRASDQIMCVLNSINPPISVAAAVGLLEVIKFELMREYEDER
jgi:hypothetical protein